MAIASPNAAIANPKKYLLEAIDVRRTVYKYAAARVAQSAAIRDAFARLFPEGLPLLVNGQPLRTRTDADGAYFLPIPPDTSGFVVCTLRPGLTIATLVRGRQAGETLTGQDVSPPSHFFATFLQPLFTPQEVQAIADNYILDIGNLREPAHGIVHFETINTPEGQIIADTNGDGVVCAFAGGPQAAAVLYPAADGAAYLASALFKALLVEAQDPATASYTTILTNILTRTEDQAGNPLLQVRAGDLVAGGVRAARAPVVADLLNRCFNTSIVNAQQGLGTALPRVVRAGRLRATVRDASGTPLPNARVAADGVFTVAGSRCPNTTPLESATNHLVCPTNSNGQVTFILFGPNTLALNPVTLTATSADGTLTSQIQTHFMPPASRDITVTIRP